MKSYTEATFVNWVSRKSVAGLDLEVKDLEVVCSSKVKMKKDYLGA